MRTFRGDVFPISSHAFFEFLALFPYLTYTGSFFAFYLNRVFWTVVHNKVYDITSYIPHHPGGEIVKFCAGRDGTDLMESYHPTVGQKKALVTLRKYYIGELKDAPEEPDNSFFLAVRERCDARLQEIGWGRHFFEFISVTEVFATIALYLYGSFAVAYQGSYFWALMVGLLTARLGFFMHMGNHRAMSSNKYINVVIEKVMDLIGGSSKIWTHEHAVAHHLTPNQLWTDNDCSIAYPWLRFHPGLPWKWYHPIQAPFTVLAITIGTAKWYISDVIDHLKGHVGSQSFFVTSYDWTILLGFKALYFLLHIYLPAVNQGWQFALTAACIVFAVSSHYLENVFIVNHIQDNLVPDDSLHWSAKQVIGSADWSVGSHFWNWWSGGLNHQIVHHLFPSVSHWCYPILAPIVKDACKEFNLPYIEYSNFAVAYKNMFMYLHKLGKAPGNPEHLSHTKVHKRKSLAN